MNDVKEPGKSKTPRKKKKKKITPGGILLVVVFLLGFGVTIYPLISQVYYYKMCSSVVAEFDKGVKGLNREDIDRRMGLAHAYNESLNTGAENLHDPYSDAEKAAGRAEYARMLEINEQIGTVKIPKIMLDAPIYAGTSEEVLQKGIGHLEGTSLPVGGNGTHAVITGHRGLPSARLFTDLDKLGIGDRFYIKNLGETIAYQVEHKETIEPDDFSQLLVEPGHDYVTLLTCTPYMVNSHRLILRGHRIPYFEAQEEQDLKDNRLNFMYKYLFFGTLAILILVLLLQLKQYLKARKEKKRLAKSAESKGESNHEKKD